MNQFQTFERLRHFEQIDQRVFNEAELQELPKSDQQMLCSFGTLAPRSPRLARFPH